VDKFLSRQELDELRENIKHAGSKYAARFGIITKLLDHIDALERQVRAEAEANNVIDVDGLRVGVCTVRAYREQIKFAEERIEQLERQVEAYSEALKEIENPIAYWKEHLEEGHELNIHMCLHMADQAETYKGIARKAFELSNANPAASSTKDAQRYRWLRQQQWDSSDIFVVTGSKSQIKLGTYCPSLNLLDEAIDSAISMKAAIASAQEDKG
jgi:cysteinyl-tRNA synthetase